MNILIFAKKDKPGLNEVMKYLSTHFNKLVTFIGEGGNKFPSESFSYKPDVLISYMSPWIIPLKLLNQTKNWNINFHPGPPNYPGIGCTNFAIYNEEKKYGVTAHIMEEKVDSGRIIGVKRFPILKIDTVYSLTIKSYRYLIALFYEVFDYIIKYKTLDLSDDTTISGLVSKDGSEYTVVNKEGEFWLPNGLFIDKNNRIYVADTYNSRIQIFQLMNK